MTTNDILHHVRYLFNLSDAEMLTLFTQAECAVTATELNNYLKKNGDPDFCRLKDPQLSCFLNGLIIEKRGKKDGAPHPIEAEITNNIIFNKLKISLAFKADDIIKAMALADCTISKHELSAYFRKPDHKHYRKCQDSILSAFLTGLQIQLRGSRLQISSN